MYKPMGFKEEGGLTRGAEYLEEAFEIITTTTPTIPYYTINPSYCWMPEQFLGNKF